MLYLHMHAFGFVASLFGALRIQLRIYTMFFFLITNMFNVEYAHEIYTLRILYSTKVK